MALQYITINNKTSLDYGLYVKDKDTFKSPRRDVEYISVPGRNGDLILDNGRYENVEITYDLAFVNDPTDDFDDAVKDIKEWLYAPQGYFKLSDSYDSSYYRWASLSSNVDLKQQLNDFGDLSITFNCKPFKYSFIGDGKLTLTTSGAVLNPEVYSSKPYMKITGSGACLVVINNVPCAFSSVDEYVEIDSEMMTVYKGSTLKNNTFVSNSFPVLKAGVNTVTLSNTITKLEIIPRWCCL